MILRREVLSRFSKLEKRIDSRKLEIEGKGLFSQESGHRELDSLYTYGVRDGRRSAGFSLLPLSVHPEALFSSPVPL